MPQTRYLCGRLRKRFPELTILVGVWGRVRDFDRLFTRLRAAGASYVVTSVEQTRGQMRAMLPKPPAVEPTPSDPDPTCGDMKRPTVPLAVTGVVLALAVLFGNAYISYQNTKRLREKESWVNHTQEVIGQLSGIFADICNAATAQRGYLLTGDESFLAPLRPARADADHRVTELGGLIADNPHQGRSHARTSRGNCGRARRP